jgi:energy-coupling factor transporter ATP-binding protein EcfA2
MLILVGPPGAGKSTLATAIRTAAGPQGGWIVVNQDSIGNRRQCEDLVLHVLGGDRRGRDGGNGRGQRGPGGGRKDWSHLSGTKVIIDRCNIGTAALVDTRTCCHCSP